MNHQIKSSIYLALLSLSLFLGIPALAQSTNNNPWVKVENGHLAVLSSDNTTYTPYFIKGAGYEPIPIGRYPSDWGYPLSDPRSANHNIYDDPDILIRDFSLLKNMNANTIRIWKGNKTTVSCQCTNNGRFTNFITDANTTINADKSKNTLDLASQYGLKVIAGFWMNDLMFDGNNNIQIIDDNGNLINKQQIIANFVNYVNTLKGNRAVLFWSIGNENNYQVLNARGAVPKADFENTFGISYGDAIYYWLQQVGNFINYNGGIIVDLNSAEVVGILAKQYPSDYAAILSILKRYSGQKLTPAQLTAWYSLVDQMAAAAHLAEDPTGGKNYHPVAVVNGNVAEIGNFINGTTDTQMPNLDIWGTNVYFGQSFGSLFTDYAAKSRKPLWIAEFGIDAWTVTNATGINNWGNSLILDLGGTGVYDQAVQSAWDVSLWNEILNNSSVTVGGTLMEYSDEWWKPYEFYCTSYENGGYNNSISAGICNSNQTYFGFPFLSSNDGYSNEKWYGIVAISRNPQVGGADIVTPRLVYSGLKQQWLANPWVNLNINVNGTGSGLITASTTLGEGLNCSFSAGVSSGVCTASFTKSHPVTLTFSSTNNSMVANWGITGCAAGSNSCTLTPDQTINLNIAVNQIIAATPAITSQPSDVTVTSQSTASFSVAATGAPTLKYQWMKQAPGATAFTAITGATSSTYTTGANAAANNGTKYQCVVRNNFGSVTSAPALLTVNVLPVITKQPSAVTVNAPLTASFTITATGTPAPTYQWMQQLPGESDFSAISGAKSAKYITAATSIANNGTKYQCIVTNAAGSVASSVVTLSVNAAAVITSQPANVSVTAPATASFTVAATGNPTPTFQWMKLSPGATNYTVITGATSSTYVTPATVLANSSTKYQCVVKNSFGTVTSLPATLTVTSTSQPAPTNVNLFVNAVSTLAPGKFVLGVNYTAYGPVSKIEYYNGSTLLATVSAINPFYTWNNVSAGSYAVTARVYDNVGNVTTSGTVNLMVSAVVPPNVSLITPANNESYTAPANISISAAASPTVAAIRTLSLYNNGVLVNTCTAGTCSGTIWNQPAGQYTLTATATDINGISASTSVIVTVKQPGPTNVTLFYNPVSTKSPGQFVFGANYNASSPVTKIEYYNGTSLLGTASAANPFYPWNNVPAGSYSISVKVYDAAGNVTASVPVNLTVTSS